MMAGYIFIGACFTLMGLALGLLTREVFAEKAHRRNANVAPQDFSQQTAKSPRTGGSRRYGHWPMGSHAPIFRAK